MWTTMYLGGGLWIAVSSVGSGLLVNIFFFYHHYRNFFKAIFLVKPSNEIVWLSEIWPMQWRLAIGGIVGYFMFSLFVPVMFHYQGPEVAGKMGMTWQIIGSLGPLAMAWISTKVPSWGILIAKKEYLELDRNFYKASGISILIIVFGALVIFMIVYGLNYYQHPLAQRMLAPLPTLLFLLGAIGVQVSSCFSNYLRAHKKEPIMLLGVSVGLTTGLLVWILGSKYGPLGAGVSFFLVTLLSLPLIFKIWKRCRYEWHK